MLRRMPFLIVFCVLNLPLLITACGNTSEGVNGSLDSPIRSLATDVDGQTYLLRNECSGAVADVFGSEQADGGVVGQWMSGTGSNQLWRLRATDSGYYKLVAKHSNKLMFVSGSKTLNGTYIEQWEDFNALAQQWQFIDVGRGHYKISPRHSTDKMLTVEGGSINNGARLQIASNAEGCSQRWKIEPSGFNYAGPIVIKDFDPITKYTAGTAATLVDTSGIRHFIGNWETSDNLTPAILIDTTQPIIIEKSNIRGAVSSGALIGWGRYGTDVTIRNTNFYGVNPNVDGLNKGQAVKLGGPVNFVFENNYIESLGGILINDYQGKSSNSLKIRYNKVINIDGRVSNGGGVNSYRINPRLWCSRTNSTDCTPDGGFIIANFFQLSNSPSKANIEVSWNRIENEPGKSAVEDNINIYSSSGIPGSPIQIYDNLIRGAYHPTPSADYSGGGILLGDGCKGGYQEAFGNSVLETSNYGIAIANGTNMFIHHNTIYGRGKTDSGAYLDASDDAGIYIRNYCTKGIDTNSDGIDDTYLTSSNPQDFNYHDPNTDRAYQNKIGWGVPTSVNENARFNIGIGSIQYTVGSQSSSAGINDGTNTSGDAGAGVVSQATINNATFYWEQHARNNGVIPGPR